MNDKAGLETRLRAVEDRLEIQALAARFSDAVNERNIDAFSQLWALGKPIWEIGPPFSARAEGLEAIVELVRGLLLSQQYFMQMTHSGVVAIDGDRAIARFVEREHGKGAGTYYDCLAVYEDVVVREPRGWRFRERHYRYRFLDQEPFKGEAFSPSR